MADVYCTRADLYAFGLPRGALPNPGRHVAGVDTDADTLALEEHGFSANDVVRFRAEGGGTLPAPLTAGVDYYAIEVTDATFSVAEEVDGAAIDLTTAGSRILVIAPVPYDAAISWASRIIDQSLPAHAAPLTLPVNELVKMTCAELAVGKLLQNTGAASKSLGEMVDAAQKRIAMWAKGVPLRGENTPAANNLAASATVPYSDPRGWNRWGGL